MWEGDCCFIFLDFSFNLELELEIINECIIWVDGFYGMVRVMDMVILDIGLEVIVRILF